MVTCLFVDELTVMDFSYLHPDRGMLGESWLVDVEIHGELDDEGVIFDFSKCKKAIKQFIDSWSDHKLVVPIHSPFLDIKSNSGYTYISYSFGSSDKKKIMHYKCPIDALCLVNTEEISIANFTLILEKKLIESMPSNVHKLKITLREEKIDIPYYHYSHGLKKHYGNCQRMAHGHRSKIEIWENEQLSSKWMSHWSKLWKDIYIASVEDMALEDEHVYHFKYQSSQGIFEMQLPKTCCYLLDGDTTVERLAEHIGRKIKSNSPHSSIKVKAYEGYQKGSLYHC